MNNSIARSSMELSNVSPTIESRPIRVLVVEDHALMRVGITAEVNAQPDMVVVADACNGEEGIRQFRAHRPDVTLLDMRTRGLETIRYLRDEFPAARIVALTMSSGDIQALRAFEAGAVGCLLKNLLQSELIETIRHVHGGLRWIPVDIAQQIAQHSGEHHLTIREIEVLEAVAKGQSNKTIAHELTLSENTIKNYLKSLLSKLHAKDRTDAVMIGIRRGYIEI